MYNILTLNKIAACGTDLFDEKYTVSDNAADPDAIMVRSAKMHDMEFGKNLLAIGRAGAGVNNIPVDKCAEQGIVVFNTPGANANAVKELVLTALLISSRRVPDALGWAQGLKGNGSEVGAMVEKGKSQFAGPEIKGKTLGVIGLGAIGILVANAAISLGMKVVGYDKFLSVNAALRLSSKVTTVSDPKDVYAQADYITIHVPYNPETKGTVNAESIALMKDGVRIINLARGELADNDAVIAGLESGKIAAYVTDFPSDDILGVKNVIALPHLGASTPEAEDNCAVMAAEELIDYLENGNIKNSVNFPNASMDAVGTKVCVLHKNVPSVISEITSVFGKDNINIENMVNASRKENAYTMIEASGDITDKIVTDLEAVENVIRVRVIR
ncbi:MAG: phosphoglycerate dehydrogenase [Oscillospiraceae bacterium]|nr:phosphoglycerate dehydrogenase [Oscillospiraceae bacterium]